MKNPFSFERKPCLYCGANRTNHALAWFEATLGSVMVGFNERMLSSPVGRTATYAAERVLVFIAKVWDSLGVLRWNHDIAKAPMRRGQVLWEEARRRGIPMEHLRLFGISTDIFRFKIGRHWRYFNGLPRPDGPDNPALAWIDDKAVLKKRLLAAGVPAPRGGGFSSYVAARRMFETLTKPVIIKPRLGSRGRHTTTFISDEAAFSDAYRSAKQLCHFVMVEEHIHGPVYRGTVIDGKVVGVLGGEPPRITGDGVHTIIALTRMKNEFKDSRIKDVPVTAAFDAFLARQGYTRETILSAGTTIDLSEKIGVSYGGRSIEVTGETHPSFIAYLEKAAEVIGDPILGFDFIVLDITKSADEQRWGIIECNAVPFINLHHDPLVGTPRNAAGAVWDMIISHTAKR